MDIEVKKIRFKEKEKANVQIEMQTIHDLDEVAKVLNIPVIKRGQTYYVFQSDKIIYYFSNKGSEHA